MKTLNTLELLDLEEAVLLPERETLAFLNVAAIDALNLSAAVNVLSLGSTASSAAIQSIPVSQY